MYSWRDASSSGRRKARAAIGFSLLGMLVVTVRFDHREVVYEFGELDEVSLAYAITIHKSQGSEFEAVIIPVLTQHFKMLFRNLIYTGLTRARKLAVFVGTRKALSMAVRNQDTSQRQTALQQLLGFV